MLERAVVDRRDMPDEVRPEPERQSDERVSQEPNTREPLELARQRRRKGEHDQAGRPFGGDDVLQEMNREQVVQRDRVQRGHIDREQQDHREVEGGLACRVRRPPALAPEVGGAEGTDRKQDVPVQRPRMRIHAATLLVTRPWRSGSTGLPSSWHRFEPGRALCTSDGEQARERARAAARRRVQKIKVRRVGVVFLVGESSG